MAGSSHHDAGALIAKRFDKVVAHGVRQCRIRSEEIYEVR
jgi:hypothetical protein